MSVRKKTGAPANCPGFVYNKKPLFDVVTQPTSKLPLPQDVLWVKCQSTLLDDFDFALVVWLVAWTKVSGNLKKHISMLFHDFLDEHGFLGFNKKKQK